MSEANAICNTEEKPVEYREIPGFPGYRAGSDGSIQTKWIRGRNSGGFNFGEWRKLRPATIKHGYKQVNLRMGGASYTFGVHWLVLLAFCPTDNDQLFCCHNNNTPWDNRLENLRWDTPKGNQADRINAGTDSRGERCHLAKLNTQNVIDIRNRYAAGGVLISEIAAEHNVTPDAIRLIIEGKRWAHVEGPRSVINDREGQRRGGLKGGRVRSERLSKERMSEIGRMGAEAARIKRLTERT